MSFGEGIRDFWKNWILYDVRICVTKKFFRGWGEGKIRYSGWLKVSVGDRLL